jgi:TolB-like protein/Tfp pilus assembly protein PilF
MGSKRAVRARDRGLAIVSCAGVPPGRCPGRGQAPSERNPKASFFREGELARPVARPDGTASLPAPAPPGAEEASRLLGSLEELSLDRYTIVGRYARFDPHLRASLDEFRQRLVSSLAGRGSRPKNFLIWGPPGSGKSYLVQQVAASLEPGVRFAEWNLSRLGEGQLRSQLDTAWNAPGPLLGFLDEIDALPDASWPYELLLTYLEPRVPRAEATCFVLAGSGGDSPEEMRRAIERRPKGRDLLSRIPATNEYRVDPLGTGDRILVATTQILEAAEDGGHRIRDVEKLALYYVAVSSGFASARQLRALADETAQRIPLGETRVRYDHLFRPGDPENKRFWSHATSQADGLMGAYIRVHSGLATRPGRPDPHSVAVAGPPSRGGIAPPTRIAVLPFRNISPDPADAYLAEGLSEEITATISTVPGVEVVSRTSALGYKGAREKPASQIGVELNAGSLLDGSVRKVGAQLRISAQFIDAPNDRQVWGEVFEGDLNDVFGMQKAIAARVAQALVDRLGGGVSPQPRRKAPPNLEAYLFLMKGRAAWREATREGLERAIALYQEALARDPNYSEALSGIAACYGRIGFWEYVPSAEPLQKAMEYALRAIAADPDSPEAHLNLAMLARASDWDWVKAEAEIRKVIALDPRLARGHTTLANILSETGQFEEAAEEARLGMELEPQSSTVAEFAGVALLYSRKYGPAVEALRRAFALDEHNVSALHNLGLALVQDGSFEEGVGKMSEALRRSDSPSPIQLMELAYGHVRAGNTAEAQAILDRLVRTAASNPAWWAGAAGVFASLGQIDDAIAALERAVAHHTSFLPAHLRHDFILDPLRADPRYLALLRRVGIEVAP